MFNFIQYRYVCVTLWRHVVPAHMLFWYRLEAMYVFGSVSGKTKPILMNHLGHGVREPVSKEEEKEKKKKKSIIEDELCRRGSRGGDKIKAWGMSRHGIYVWTYLDS